MCSEGVSVWFACKLCKSFFLNADDFAYHKKKSHVQEFGNTKFIVFEEQTSPPASPPENWVSFLPPKEETLIHKIISSPTLLTPTQIKTSESYNPSSTSSEIIQSNRNQEFIEIDLETNSVIFISNDKGGSSNDEVESSTNLYEPNCHFSRSNDDVDEVVNLQEIDLVQSSIAPKSTDLTDKIRDKLVSSKTKSALKYKTNSLERSNKKIPNVASKTALLQTVIQSPNIPYVFLKRLNLTTIQNASSSHSNNTICSQENDKSDTNHTTLSAQPAKRSKVKGADQDNIYTSNNAITSPPLTTFESCKFCSKHFNSNAELGIHEDLCRLRSQFENILCVPCLLKFGSSDELNAHNRSFHSAPISTPTPDTTKGHQTELSDDLEVALTNEIMQNCPSRISNDGNSNNADLNSNFDLDAVSNLDNHDHDGADVVASKESINSNQKGEPHFVSSPNLISTPITEVNLDYGYGDLIKVVKEEFVIDGSENEGSQFSDEYHDPIESESSEKLVAEETCNVADTSSNKLHKAQAPQSRLNCKIHHETQDGERRFKCPYPSCEIRTRNKSHLKSHLSQVHSNVRPFKCPHPNCTQYFKTGTNRNKHLKRHK